MKNIADILTQCIEDVRAGRNTMEECLTRYPDMRHELEPLLRIALSIQEPPLYKPTGDFKNRARVSLMEYIHEQQSVKKSWIDGIFGGIRQGFQVGWLRTMAIAVAIVVALSAAGGGTAYAARDSLPGDTLYFAKTTTEQVRRIFTIDDIARVELELEFAGTRLEEMAALAQKHPERIGRGIEGYDRNIALAIEQAESAGDIATVAAGLEIAANAISRHFTILDGIHDGAGTTAMEAINQARENAFRIQTRALGALAEDKPVQATEINIHAMQNRLQRALAKADEGDTAEAETAVWQFTEMYQFGEEIAQKAREQGHDTTAIDTLNAQAEPEQLEIIGKMHGKISDEAVASAEKALGVGKGNKDKGDTTPPGKSGEDNGSGKPDKDTGKPDKDAKETGNSTEYTAENSEETGALPEEPGTSPEQPGTSPEQPGNPPGPPDTPPGQPGTPPEEPGSENSGNGKS